PGGPAYCLLSMPIAAPRPSKICVSSLLGAARPSKVWVRVEQSPRVSHGWLPTPRHEQTYWKSEDDRPCWKQEFEPRNKDHRPICQPTSKRTAMAARL